MTVSALDRPGRKARQSAGVTELVEELPGGASKRARSAGGHLGSPVPEAGDGRKPGPLGGEARLAPGPALVEAEHRIVEREPQESAQGPALPRRDPHQVLVENLVVEPRAQRAPASRPIRTLRSHQSAVVASGSRVQVAN